MATVEKGIPRGGIRFTLGSSARAFANCQPARLSRSPIGECPGTYVLISPPPAPTLPLMVIVGTVYIGVAECSGRAVLLAGKRLTSKGTHIPASARGGMTALSGFFDVKNLALVCIPLGGICDWPVLG